MTVYPKLASGNVIPLQTISGSNTGLVNPYGVSADGAGNIYVADFFANSVLVYDAGATGNVAPVATISEAMNYPSAIVLDDGGNVYVTNFEGESVTVYAAHTYQLIRTVTSQSIGYAGGIALDTLGNTYVLNTSYSGLHTSSGGGWVAVFAPDAKTNAVPIQTIFGPKTEMQNVRGIAVDAKRRIYVSNNRSRAPQNQILVFAPGATGNVRPIRVIEGSQTHLGANAIALDSRGTIFVGSSFLSAPPSVNVYRSGVFGNVAPIREIAGGNTGLDMPEGISVR